MAGEGRESTSGDDETTSSPTKGEAEKATEMVDKLAEEMGIPTWGLVAIGIGEYRRGRPAECLPAPVTTTSKGNEPAIPHARETDRLEEKPRESLFARGVSTVRSFRTAVLLSNAARPACSCAGCSRNMRLLHKTVLPEATVQRRQEGHEGRRGPQERAVTRIGLQREGGCTE